MNETILMGLAIGGPIVTAAVAYGAVRSTMNSISKKVTEIHRTVHDRETGNIALHQRARTLEREMRDIKEAS